MPHSAHDDRAFILRNIRAWIAEVLEEKGWTANEWAVKAGTSPTNITRVLRQDIIPTASTIGKLAAVAGSQPSMSPIHKPLKGTLPVYRKEDVILCVHGYREGKPLMKSTVKPLTLYEGRDSYFGVLVWNKSLDLAGIAEGDVAMIDPDAKPLPGDYVLVEYAGIPVMGEYQTTHVIFKSSEPDHEAIQIVDVDILGCVVSVLREFKGRSR